MYIITRDTYMQNRNIHNIKYMYRYKIYKIKNIQLYHLISKDSENKVLTLSNKESLVRLSIFQERAHYDELVSHTFEKFYHYRVLLMLSHTRSTSAYSTYNFYKTEKKMLDRENIQLDAFSYHYNLSQLMQMRKTNSFRPFN